MKILLHTCCAPCLTWFVDSKIDLVSYFYNPNLYPEAEFVKRYFTLKNYASAEKVPLVFDFDKSKTVAGDCSDCYEKRLRKTAEYAKKNGFESFTTTLLISPYQNHELIRKIGAEAGEEAGVKFFYRDFRDGYKRGRELSRQFQLYRQKYCGCEVSHDSTKKVTK
ncbi:hypothetical protein A2276_02495 [candidate division WOR-1 bacterium RIFOXYA12_FULL_43_27]|uniref:Epoxyqueuosine reductase QueH n=1 Tax=candidate division WOR-1 bacterium RIFOXYC2_FULL_46_14 TaxID=1802587 RepID=A0A1F4U7S3_UNCSA|nr:MAG: hypothetical protein A2276_02495 [candidate division WOR-1 bacterium RIFOXYA12_FULL_43_27]OGC19419.1 MAG: hypothetical protein A2292_01835 [candidate division WOR-1 bacterium RIFOXYB2_FULL_46_45]OGC30408.1 MAG: hypothetical protein A2232_01835 [candidate division WOR-1 bacterium RIFOXYA2_FULL_46_56]OGC41008.1 MAG: hypothetical protein A2438_01835 [candidate division WOR-1 bacterium RIFOXYC2_FULL_46_14]